MFLKFKFCHNIQHMYFQMQRQYTLNKVQMQNYDLLYRLYTAFGNYFSIKQTMQ